MNIPLEYQLLTNYQLNKSCIRCSILLEALGKKYEILKSPGLEEITLLATPFEPKKSEITEKPAEKAVITAYAICKKIIQNTGLKERYIEIPCLQEEDTIFWILSYLDNKLESVNQQDHLDAFDMLQEKFLSRKRRRFLFSDSLSLVDIFLWSSVRSCQTYDLLMETKTSLTVPKGCNLTRFQILRLYLSEIQALEYVSKGLSKLGFTTLEHNRDMGKFYITTAINYTNSYPHIGHMYEGIIADVIARFHRFFNENVFFLTGTDEHGQKIDEAARKREEHPIEICNFFANEFMKLNWKINMSNDVFVRTTSPEHIRAAQEMWKKVSEKGDIYLGKYVGWYSLSQEAFVTDKEAENCNYKDSLTNEPLIKMAEPSFFFKMSKYQERLVNHINTHPDFILPKSKRNEILARLEQPLEDLSVSRVNFQWGIQVPDNEQHVIYVWFDALISYLSGLNNASETRNMTNFWPADCHLVGKDIIWFHTVIWPCMLFSLELPLPVSVFCHGFVVASDGRKMSKSLGNVVSPGDLFEKFPNIDTIRFCLIKSTELGRDLKFEIPAFKDMHNSDLADNLGNLVHRVTALCHKYCDGKVPDCPCPDGAAPTNLRILLTDVRNSVKQFRLQETLDTIMAAFRDTNKYLTAKTPWSPQISLPQKQKVCRVLLETIYILTHFLEPFIPETAHQIFSRLNTSSKTIEQLSCYFDNLIPGNLVERGDILFAKIV